MNFKKISYIVVFTLIVVLCALWCQNRFYKNYPIDLVYTWVNGNDKHWRQKKGYWQKKLQITDYYAVGKERFRDREELKHSLRSVELYMPWIRNIYIVTDNQVPDWLNLNHPKIKIVDHKDILPADALPVFNSMAIETGLANIEGLAEHFIYFNDDVFVNVPVTPDFFFDKNGKPIIYEDEKLKKEGLEEIRLNNQETWVQSWKQMIDVIIKKYKVEPFIVVGTHTAAVFNKTDFKYAINEFKEGFDKTSHSKFRQFDDYNIGIVDMVNFIRNRVVVQDSEIVDSKFDCEIAGYSVMTDLDRLKTQKPCLFCLNDAKFSDDNISFEHTKYLRKRFPNKSSFEK